MFIRSKGFQLTIACLALATIGGWRAGTAAGTQPSGGSLQASGSQAQPDAARPDFARMVREQAETDRAWQLASEGYMRMEKITYRSSRGDLEIPAFVFRPLARGGRRHPAIVWVHEDIRGHLYEHHIPFIRDAVARGYVVIAPEYRGSIGYGRTFYDAIDYGGAEVE